MIQISERRCLKNRGIIRLQIYGNELIFVAKLVRRYFEKGDLSLRQAGLSFIYVFSTRRINSGDSMLTAREGILKHRPLYEELILEFCRRIMIGRWPVGRPLKAEAAIATEFNVSLGTVRRALDSLSEMNLIDRSPGRGITVLNFNNDRRLASLSNLVDLEGQFIRADIEIGGICEVWADEGVAAGLALFTGSRVVKVERRKRYRGRVFEIETAFSSPSSSSHALPEAEIALREAQDLIVNDQIAARRDERIRLSCSRSVAFGAVLGTDNAALLNARRTLFSVYGDPIEYSEATIDLGDDINISLRKL